MTDAFKVTFAWDAGATAQNVDDGYVFLRLTIDDLPDGGASFGLIDANGAEGSQWLDWTAETPSYEFEIAEVFGDWNGVWAPTATQTYRIDFAGDAACWAWGYAPDTIDPLGDCSREDPTL